MPKENQQPTTLLPNTVKFLSGGADPQIEIRSNTIRYLLAGRYYQDKSKMEKETITELEVYRKIAATLPIDPKDVIAEMAKISSEISDEQEKDEFLQNVDIFLQQLMLTDSFDQKLKGLKDYLRDNENSDDAKMAADPDPVVQAFYQMIKNEPASIRDELYRSARMTALHDQVLRTNITSGTVVRVDVKTKQRELVERNTGSAGTIDIDKYISEELTRDVSAQSIQQMAADVARDLKNRQLAMLAQIEPSTLHEPAVQKRLGMVALFNNIGRMLVTDLVMAKDQAHQQRIYDFYLELLDQSMKNHDYQTVMAILGGLNDSAVSHTRLPYLEDKKRLLEKHESLMSPMNSFKRYRAELKKDPGSVPYLGLYIGDLTFINDGNPSHSTVENIRVMNLDRCEKEGTQLTDVQDRQERALHYLSRSAASTSSSNIVARIARPNLSAEESFSLSQEIYPRALKQTGGKPFKSERPTFEQLKASRTLQATNVVLERPLPSAAVAQASIIENDEYQHENPLVMAEFARLRQKALEPGKKGKESLFKLFEEAKKNILGSSAQPQTVLEALAQPIRKPAEVSAAKPTEVSAVQPARVVKPKILDHEEERRKREMRARQRSKERQEGFDKLRTDLELRRSQALDYVKAIAVQAAETTPVRDAYYKIVEEAANKAARDFNLPDEAIPGIIEAVYNDPNVLYASPSSAFTKGPIPQLPIQKEAVPGVLHVSPVSKFEILDKALDKFLEMSKGRGAASVRVMLDTQPIVRELKRIKEDTSLNTEQKEENAYAFLLDIAKNPKISPFVVEIVGAFLVEPAFAKLDKVQETGQRAVQELEAQTQQRADERTAKAKAALALPVIELKGEERQAITDIEELSRQAVEGAGVQPVVEEASVLFVEESADILAKRNAKLKSAFAELSDVVSIRGVQGQNFLSLEQCDSVLGLIAAEKLKYKDNIPQSLLDFEKLMNHSKGLIVASEKIITILARANDEPSNLTLEDKQLLKTALSDYSAKMGAFVPEFEAYAIYRKTETFKDLNPQLDMIASPVQKIGSVTFNNQLLTVAQRSTRVSMPIEEMLKIYPLNSPEYDYWSRINAILKRHSVAADTQAVKITDIAKKVALNSPVWLIEADKPKRGNEPTSMTVVRVIGDVAIDRKEGPMQTGMQYTYPVTTKVHALTRLSSQPALFATMGPDQFLSKEGVGLHDDTINRIVSLFQSGNNLSPATVEKLKSELKALTLNELYPSWKPQEGKSKGFEEVIKVLASNGLNADSKNIANIGLLLQADLGGRHVALVAQEIGVGEPKRYAALTIAGTKRSETSGFGIDRGRVSEGMASLHTTILQDKSVVPTASVYVDHNQNISQHLVLQSGGEIEGKPTTLAFYGSDLDHIVNFYLSNKAAGVPIVVNCTDGIDRTGMLVTAIAMLNEYNKDKTKDFTKNTTLIQEKRLLQIIEELRQDRGPFFLRGNEDIAIAVTLGYALIATQKQLEFQKSLESKQDLPPLLKSILDQSKQIEPEALQVKLDEALDKLNAEDAQIAEDWLSLVTARVAANSEYLKANRKGEYKDSFDSLPRSNMADGDWAKLRKPISFSDFASLKKKGIDVNPFITLALRNFIELPSIETINALAKFIGENKSNDAMNLLIDDELKRLGLNKQLLNAILTTSKSEKIDREALSNLTLPQKEACMLQLKVLIRNAPDNQSKAIFKKVMKFLPSDVNIASQQAVPARQPIAHAPTTQAEVFADLEGRRKESQRKVSQPAAQASSVAPTVPPAASVGVRKPAMTVRFDAKANEMTSKSQDTLIIPGKKPFPRA